MTKTPREVLDSLDASYDAAIESAMENATDVGFVEATDEDAFYAQVLGEVTA